MRTPLPRRTADDRKTTSRNPFGLVRPTCEQLEDRTVPALFEVQSSVLFSGGRNFGSVASGDLNKDGFMDAVLTDFGTGYGSPTQTGTTPGTSVFVMYGQAGGAFNKVILGTGGDNVSFVSIADINSDGWLDAVATNANRQNTGSVTVFQNNAQSGVANALSKVGTPFSSFSNNPSWVGLADMTGDNVLDVVVGSFGKDDGTASNITGNGVTLFQGLTDANGKGNFTFTASPITTIRPVVQFIPTALAIADFDGDGKRDIAAAVPSVPPDFNQPQQNATTYVFQSTGAGGFAAAYNEYDTGGVLPVNIQAADVTGDGKPELILANAGDPQDTPEFKGNSVGVVFNASSIGNVSFGQTSSIATNNYGTFAVAVADFNLDSKADIAAVNYGSQGLGQSAFVAIHNGNGAGSFTPDTTITNGKYVTTPGLGGGQYLAVGDFDANGTPDLIVAHASSQVTVMKNTMGAPPTVEAVSINNGNAQRSRVTTVKVTFNSTVNIAAGAFSMAGVSPTGTTLASPTITVTSGTVNGKTEAVLTFSGTNTAGNSVVDGRWTLNVDRTKITTTTGGIVMAANYTQGGIHRFYGDNDGDADVDILDLAAFRQTFGKTSADTGFNAAFDSDGNSNVDILDLSQFRQRFGQVLPP